MVSTFAAKPPLVFVSPPTGSRRRRRFLRRCKDFRRHDAVTVFAVEDEDDNEDDGDDDSIDDNDIDAASVDDGRCTDGVGENPDDGGGEDADGADDFDRDDSGGIDGECDDDDDRDAGDEEADVFGNNF